MSVMTRGEFLSQNKRRYTETNLLGLGSVRIRSLTTAEMRAFRRSLQTAAGELNAERASHIQELLIATTLVDAEDNLLFTADDAINGVFDDVDGAVINRCFAAVKDWTGFAMDDDFSAVEAAIKNSRNGQSTPTPVA